MDDGPERERGQDQGTANMRALVLANGDRPSIELLRRLREEANFFIATDGAVNGLIDSGLLPDIVLGDFDSLTPGIRDRIPGVEFVQAPDQNASDLEKAIEHAIGLGCKQITIAGALGGRIDHTLVGFSLLVKYCSLMDVRIVADGIEARAIAGRHSLRADLGDTLSLIPFEPSVISLSGVKWPLRSEPLAPGSRGVSNVVTAAKVDIEVHSGTVIVVLTRREAVVSQEKERG